MAGFNVRMDMLGACPVKSFSVDEPLCLGPELVLVEIDLGLTMFNSLANTCSGSIGATFILS